MTARRDRLARLLGLRLVRLREAGRRLGMASDSARACASIAARIAELRAELSVEAGTGRGYAVKAAAATRAALHAADERHASRLLEVAEQRSSAVAAVQRRQASADAVARASDRARRASLVMPHGDLPSLLQARRTRR